MPRYLASHHAVARLGERFPALAPLAGQGLAAGQWLGRLASRARVAAQQSRMDLLLCLELPLVGGPARIYLPVTPLGHDDTWVIRTVLTEDQALANLAASTCRRQEAERAAWRARKGFTRPYVRRYHATRCDLLEVAA